jgi:SAM-dependent methyltransferase
MREQPERASPPPPPPPVRVIGKALTRMVAGAPWTWPLMRRLVRGFFDRLADGWDERVRPTRRSTWRRSPPRSPVSRRHRRGRSISAPGRARERCGLAREFPGARVTGLDISEAMIERAKAKLPAELSGRVEFLVGDAERLPFTDGSLEPVAQISVPVFFDEVARVLAPRGYVVVVSNLGPRTPFHTPEGTLRKGFRRRGIETVATGAEGHVLSGQALGLKRRPGDGTRTPPERSDARQRRRRQHQRGPLPGDRRRNGDSPHPGRGRHGHARRPPERRTGGER